MLSAVVLACDGSQPIPVAPEMAVASLAALVPAVIAGVIADVGLAGLLSDEAMRKIADHAGCTLIAAANPPDVLPAALERMRGPLVLFLRAGRVPEQGYIEELSDIVRSGAAAADGALLRALPQTALARFIPRFSPLAGVVAPLSRVQPRKAQSLDDLARQLRPSLVLRARAR